MALLDQYVRVTSLHPCPKCGHHKGCLTHSSGQKCICVRLRSPNPCGAAGWLHYGVSSPPVKVEKQPRKYLKTEEVHQFLHSIQWGKIDKLLIKHAQLLKLDVQSIWYMQAAYEPKEAVLAFPMFNAEFRPIGCRFRRRDGKKWSLKGGREGVFMSWMLTASRPVIIAEGPTDAAALVEAGFKNVLGRPNCSGGGQIIRDLLRNHPHTPVVVVSDPDEPGLAGAQRLVLSLPNPAVVLAGPSDIREYVTRFAVRTEAKQSIINVLGGYSYGDWKVVTRNLSGQLFNFSRLNHG